VWRKYTSFCLFSKPDFFRRQDNNDRLSRAKSIIKHKRSNSYGSDGDNFQKKRE